MKKTALILSVILSLCCFMTTACQASYTDTVKFNSGEAMVIAHRGLSGLEIENTDPAFIAAGERSYWGIEADLRRTADGKYVICHDVDMKRVGGVDLKVKDSTLEELMDVVLLDADGERNKDGTRLATLDSFISICKRYGKQAVLELNCDYTKEELGEILAIIDSHGYLDRVTFISFIYSNLLRVRALYPDAEAQFLFTEYSDEILQRLTDDRIDAAIAHSSVNRIIIDKFHAAGLKVNCWIVDVSIVAEQLCFMGADYITTNILEQKTK